MKVKSIAEAQRNLVDLVKQAREEAIGLTDESGNLVALLAGLDEDDLDELLVQTPAFQANCGGAGGGRSRDGSVARKR
jgi:ribosomal protein L12E/L44/L45/RPP1/RPP2